MTSSYYLHPRSLFEQLMPLPGNVMTPPPFLCRFYHPGSPEEIESHLPEHGVNGIFNHLNNRFFIANINQISNLNISFLRLAIPLAISFYTFQQIAYLVDTYRDEIKDNNYLIREINNKLSVFYGQYSCSEAHTQQLVNPYGKSKLMVGQIL